MRKKTVGIIAALFFVLAITASAVQMRMVRPTVYLTFNRTTANCSAMVTSAGDELDVTLELWHGDTLVDSWSASGSGSVAVEGSCRVIKGETYTLIVTGTASGRSFSSPPLSRTC